ncbi:MAG TPA: hypothetical protein PLF01_06145, partial [Alphaproteobacteria bacterium]|nr:hypothetical protein [Alphaproteobacteria bacterium]
MGLRALFGKKPREEEQWVCWQDGYHRSFEPMQKPDAPAPSFAGIKRIGTRIGGALALVAVSHFTGVDTYLADIITDNAPTRSVEAD